ncbi:MAG: M23 family metallopeptidase [Ignavibacteriales bacterium]|nr:M23 family metallopeptidase [Ignavibacteriales bacterium]
MKKLLFALYIFLFCSLIYPQGLKLSGEFKPGSVVVGSAKNIKRVLLDNKRLQFDKSGKFIFGFDRDAKGTHILKVIYKNGESETEKIKLPKRKYQIQRLRIAAKFVQPPKEELTRIKQEAKEMKSARDEIGKIDSALFSSGFVMPAKGEFTGVFGSQRILNGVPKNIHNGIDISADEGDSVFAAADGIVRLAGEDFYYNGNFVLIDHGQGLTSIYLHMSKLDVKTGDYVLKGQKIGEAGSTGRSTSAHLHFGIQWYKKRIDPMSLFEIKF